MSVSAFAHHTPQACHVFRPPCHPKCLSRRSPGVQFQCHIGRLGHGHLDRLRRLFPPTGSGSSCAACEGFQKKERKRMKKHPKKNEISQNPEQVQALKSTNGNYYWNGSRLYIDCLIENLKIFVQRNRWRDQDSWSSDCRMGDCTKGYKFHFYWQGPHTHSLTHTHTNTHCNQTTLDRSTWPKKNERLEFSDITRPNDWDSCWQAKPSQQ